MFIPKTCVNELNAIWKAGYEAGAEGKPAQDNPFLDSDELSRVSAWVDGWHSGVVNKKSGNDGLEFINS